MQDLTDVIFCESNPTSRKKVIILGGGPNRIGQGIEFDYACVHAAIALKEANIEAIMINCNPETVSTDYDISDRLYFEPLEEENVINIVHKEIENGQLLGVIVQFGGQTPLKLAKYLIENNISIIGTPYDSIDLTEDRDRFKYLLQQLNIKQPQNYIARNQQELSYNIDKIGFPIVVRPSYVLGGKGMAIIYDKQYLQKYLTDNVDIFDGGPLLLDEFLSDAIEVDVDALSDGNQVCVAGIMQHIEEAGIHSGDSACCIPPYSLTKNMISEIESVTKKLALALKVKGLMNVQYAIKDDELYILEVNPRASRSAPFVAKATGVPIVKIATFLMVGKKLADFDLTHKINDKFCVKEAVFPFNKFSDTDTILGPEMKSTGEVMGIDESFELAFAKAQIAANGKLPLKGIAFISVKDSDKERCINFSKKLSDIGFKLLATEGTAKFLNNHNIKTEKVKKFQDGSPNIVEKIEAEEVDLIINTSEGTKSVKDSFLIRRTALVKNVTYSTTITGANVLVDAIIAYKKIDGKLKVFKLNQ